MGKSKTPKAAHVPEAASPARGTPDLTDGFGAGGLTEASEKMVEEVTKTIQAKTLELEALIKAVMEARLPMSLGHLLQVKKVAPLAHLQFAFQNLCNTAELLKTDAQNMFDLVRKNVLPDCMQSLNTDLVRVPGLGRVELATDAYCSALAGTIKMPAVDDDGNPLPEDHPLYELEDVDLRGWLVRQGLGDMIKDTVNASSLKAAIKRKIEAGIEVPAELVKFQPYTYSKIVKG